MIARRILMVFSFAGHVTECDVVIL